MQPHHSELVETPSSICRIPIFEPTRRPQTVSAFYVETAWGHATITGKIGQQHRDLIDAARSTAEKEEWTLDGCMHLKVDPARLRSALGGDKTNYVYIDKLLKDLRKVDVDVYIKALDKTISGGIVSEHANGKEFAVQANKNRTLFTGKEERRYLRISFSSGWSKLIEDDYVSKYPLETVIKMKHGFCQAAARFCISHASVNETVASLMQKLNAKGHVRNKRKELEDDSDLLADMGIIFDGNRILKQKRGYIPVKNNEAPLHTGVAPLHTGSRRHIPVKNGFSQ
jgi:hypothetical protein